MGEIVCYRQFKRLRVDFKVNGHSNYNLSLKDGIVTKTSKGNDERLKLSALKQSQFQSEYFKVPKVHEINNDGFSMDYILGFSFVEFLTYATKNDLDKLIKKLEGYFSETIEGVQIVPTEILRNKIISINERWLKEIPPLSDIEIYKGKTHGDMTFSNIIFSNDFYLIDFLDSYIESPMMDLIKLRQDTHLQWSFEMYDKPYDKTKVQIVLSYIDEWLVNTYDFTHYNILQIINLLRILPYTKSKSVFKYLRNNINKLTSNGKLI